MNGNWLYGLLNFCQEFFDNREILFWHDILCNAQPEEELDYYCKIDPLFSIKGVTVP